MMKQLKKALSILCAIALLISGMTFALAEDTDNSEAASITAQQEDNQPAEEEAAAQAAEEEAAAKAAEEEAAAKAAEEEAAAKAAEEEAARKAAEEEAAAKAAEEEAARKAAEEEAAAKAAEEEAAAKAAEEEAAAKAAEEEAAAKAAEEEAAAKAAEEEAADQAAEEESASDTEEADQDEDEQQAGQEEEEDAPAEDDASDNDEEDEEEEEDEDGLVQLEDNEGYVDEEVIEENTPAITDELKGLRTASMNVGEVLTESIRFGDELTVTLKGCSVSTVTLMLYTPAGTSINTKVDGKNVSFTPADSDIPSMNLYVYELANAAGRTHEIVLTSYDTVTFSLVAAVSQVEETTEEPAAQEEETPAAEEDKETPAAPEEGKETPAEEPADETPAETPAPTIQTSVKTYDSLKVGASISDRLIAGQKAKIQVKCGKNPYVTLILSANPDDVNVTIDGQAARFTAAGNGTYTCDLDDVAFRKFSVVISAKQDLAFTLSAAARQDAEAADDEAEEETAEEPAEEIVEESEDNINEETDEQPADEASEEPAEENEESPEEVTEETEGEETEEEASAETEEETENEEENTEEEPEEETEEEAEEEAEEETEEAEPLTDDQLIELGYRKVVVENKNGADIYAGTEEAEAIGHADFESELWLRDAEAEGWAEIYTEEENAQYIKLAEIEKQPLTDEEIEALGYRKVVVLNKDGADIYAGTEEEAAVTGHADFGSELWIKDAEAEGWAEIYTEEETAQYIKLAEIEKQPLTDEEIEALGYRKVQILNQNGTDIYDSTEEEAAVIGHADFGSEIWIKDIETENWAEVYSNEETQQFVKLDEIAKQMPSDEEMLEAGYIKAYVAIDIGANVYDSSAEFEGEEPAGHLDAGAELWVKLVDGAERALIFDLNEEAPARYINLVDIIATMKPEGMEDLPTRMLEIHSSLEEYNFQVIFIGVNVTLYTDLINFREDDVYTVQWQYSADGEEFFDIEDATELSYRYLTDEDNVKYIWKVQVILRAPDETVEGIKE